MAKAYNYVLFCYYQVSTGNSTRTHDGLKKKRAALSSRLDLRERNNLNHGRFHCVYDTYTMNIINYLRFISSNKMRYTYCKRLFFVRSTHIFRGKHFLFFVFIKQFSFA